MINLILLIIYLILILAVVFLENKNPQEAILWVVILLCIPFLGAVLYIVFGSTLNMKITKEIRGRKLKRITELNYDNVNNISNDLEKVYEKYLSESDKKVVNFNYHYNDSILTCYEDTEFFINGDTHYKKLFFDIDNAKNSIKVEFYTIHNDEIGNEFIKRLTKKAEEGVDVYVICDFLANISSPTKMFRSLKEAGGKFKRIKPYVTHFRSHRKIVVIDGEIGYIGGMNIGKQYVNRAKKKNPWRDTQIRITGPCVAELEHLFTLDWIFVISNKEFESFNFKIDRYKEGNYSVDKIMQFVVGGVDNDKESIKMCYLSMIRNAKKCIRIQSPYFIPDTSILDELRVAQASGVNVELMIPGIKASFFLDPVTTYYCGKLIKYGSKIYKYNGYIHAKTMIIDDDICCIGSVNMDIRSLQVDDEICGVFYSDSIVEEYSNIFNEDIKSCKEYKKEDFNKRTVLDKVKENFLLLFAPLM